MGFWEDYYFSFVNSIIMLAKLAVALHELPKLISFSCVRADVPVPLIGLCREIVRNANTEVSGSENIFVPIVD